VLVAALSIQIIIHDSRSLKAKRSVVKSIKERLRNKFNLAVSEVGAHDKLNYAEIGLTTVGVDGKITEETLQKAVSFMENDFRFEIVNITRFL
jgi:uncharacterized protein YlxP (DUF503 family)